VGQRRRLSNRGGAAGEVVGAERRAGVEQVGEMLEVITLRSGRRADSGEEGIEGLVVNVFLVWPMSTRTWGGRPPVWGVVDPSQEGAGGRGCGNPV